MRTPVAVVAVNLSNMETHTFGTIRAAASYVQLSASNVQRCIMDDSPSGGWYFCRLKDYPSKLERIRYLAQQWAKEGKPIRPAKPHKELYSLRIDSHTVIMVTKEKCNEEYANIYRAKLKKCKSKLL